MILIFVLRLRQLAVGAIAIAQWKTLESGDHARTGGVSMATIEAIARLTMVVSQRQNTAKDQRKNRRPGSKF